MGAHTLSQDLREVDAYFGGIHSDLSVKTGYDLDVESGATLSIDGTAVTGSAAELDDIASITASAAELSKVFLKCEVTDVSTVSSTGYTVSPVAGTLTGVRTVLQGTIATADAVLTTNVNGGTNVTQATTIAYSGSAAGDTDTSTPADNNTVAVGDYIKITSAGASTNAIGADVTFEITL